MRILELNTLTEAQLSNLLALMEELSPGQTQNPAKLFAAVECPATRMFAVVEDGGDCGVPGGGRIVGCASLCVFDSPTGKKGHIEDVVVSSACRGQHLGRKLLEHMLDYARTNLAPIDIHLTSRPSRVAANTLYRSLGFEPRDTNVYRLIIE